METSHLKSRWLKFSILGFSILPIVGYCISLIFDLPPRIWWAIAQFVLAVGVFQFGIASIDNLKTPKKEISLAHLVSFILLAIALLNLVILVLQSSIPPLSSIDSISTISIEQMKELVRRGIKTTSQQFMSELFLLAINCLFIVASLLFDRWFRNLVHKEDPAT